MSQDSKKKDLIPPSINDPLIRDFVPHDETPSETTSLGEEQNKPQTWRSMIVLYIVTFIMVLARSVDFVLYVRMANKMINYEYFLGDILLSIGFCCVSWPVVWVKMWTGAITKKMRQFPNYKFILMGIFDSLAVVISTIPAALVSGPINVVMSQSVVFVNMIASFIFLHFRYTIFHYLGVLLVICGITVDVWPLFASGKDSGTDQYTWVWILLLFVANLPMAASNVYKEKYLKEAHLDVWYMNAWVAIYQLIFGILSFPITFIRLPPPASYIEPQQLPQYMANGWKCFAGINSQPGDRCEWFWAVFLVFIVFNMTYNILMLVVFQRGSSTLAVIASAARLALSNFGFLVPFLAGEAYQQKLTYFDVIALFILIAGIIVYSLTKEYAADEDDLLRRAWRKMLPCFYRRKAEIPIDSYATNNLSGGSIIYVENYQ